LLGPKPQLLGRAQHSRPEGATPTLTEGNALGLPNPVHTRAWKARPTTHPFAERASHSR